MIQYCFTFWFSEMRKMWFHRWDNCRVSAEGQDPLHNTFSLCPELQIPSFFCAVCDHCLWIFLPISLSLNTGAVSCVLVQVDKPQTKPTAEDQTVCSPKTEVCLFKLRRKTLSVPSRWLCCSKRPSGTLRLMREHLPSAQPHSPYQSPDGGFRFMSNHRFDWQKESSGWALL